MGVPRAGKYKEKKKLRLMHMEQGSQPVPAAGSQRADIQGASAAVSP